MENQELMQRGEELHQRYLEADATATLSQAKAANQAVEQHLSEYGYSYAAMLIDIVESKK